MQAYAAYWWTAAQRWSEIVAFAPLVIGARLSSAATAGARPGARHRAEMTRMVVEKSEALAESAAAVWLVALESQQLAWQRAWRAGRPAPAPADYALAVATARRLGQAWRPVSRRVTANAKRLAPTKRRTRR
jgi:hypothetical protein